MRALHRLSALTHLFLKLIFAIVKKNAVPCMAVGNLGFTENLSWSGCSGENWNNIAPIVEEDEQEDDQDADEMNEWFLEILNLFFSLYNV